MRFTSATLAALALSALLVGCSGSDEEDAEGGATSPTTSATAPVDDETRTCDVELTVSGAVEASWSGEGTSTRPPSGSPEAFYTAEWKDGSVQVFSEGGDITSSATVAVGDAAFATAPGDAQGLEVLGDGETASVDATVLGTDGAEATLVADFTCGKARKG